jgi:thiamine pyrophosphokinase
MKGDRTLLVLGGSPPSDELLTWRFEEADHAVAVDSGILAFRHAGLEPELLLGDMDSCGIDETWQQGSSLRVIKSSEPDTTDFEKALNWVSTETETSGMVILGGLGKRSDHFLSNVMISCGFDQSVDITFDGSDEWIRRVTFETPLRLVGRNGVTLSLLPLTPCSKVQTTGLKWNLQEDDLGIGQKISQSNVAVSELVTVSCESGNLFVILQK